MTGDGTEGRDTMSPSSGTLAALHRYPVKSMLGEELKRSWADERGLLGDRAFAVVDRITGKIASAKNPRLWKDLLACRARYERDPVPGAPLPAVHIRLPTGDVLSSEDPSTEPALSEFLGRSVSLLQQAPPSSSYEDYWPDLEGLSPHGHRDTMTVEPISRFGPEGTFFDMSAFHVLTRQSLIAAQSAAPQSRIESARYRPNLVIDCGTESTGPFVENGWGGRTLRIGQALALRVRMPAMRCVMTTLEQPGLPNDPDVLRSLVRANMVDIPVAGRYPCLGAYAGLEKRAAAGGEIALGDSCLLDAPPRGC